MGAVTAIMAYGSEAQKQLAARKVLGGDKPAICITEPAAGSRSDERRVGEEWVSRLRSWWWPYDYTNKHIADLPSLRTIIHHSTCTFQSYTIVFRQHHEYN